ncbi:general stress protein [Microbacterium sp.]|uniref:general stress protein n=1 Tax=Microbacterium sp. TaxID=51671 RepID=UPI003A94F357
MVASTRDYESAQKTVSKLIAGEVPARDIAIVGQSVRTVERVTGKLGYAAAARSGAVNGVLIGLFLSAILVIGNPEVPIQLFVGFVFIGVALGMLLSLVTYAIVRRRRDFASVTQFAADHYEVTVQTASLAKARRCVGPERRQTPVRPPVELHEPPRYALRSRPLRRLPSPGAAVPAASSRSVADPRCRFRPAPRRPDRPLPTSAPIPLPLPDRARLRMRRKVTDVRRSRIPSRAVRSARPPRPGAGLRHLRPRRRVRGATPPASACEDPAPRRRRDPAPGCPPRRRARYRPIRGHGEPRSAPGRQALPCPPGVWAGSRRLSVAGRSRSATPGSRSRRRGLLPWASAPGPHPVPVHGGSRRASHELSAGDRRVAGGRLREAASALTGTACCCRRSSSIMRLVRKSRDPRAGAPRSSRWASPRVVLPVAAASCT